MKRNKVFLLLPFFLLNVLIIIYKLSPYNLVNKYWYLEWVFNYILIFSFFIFTFLISSWKKITLVGLSFFTLVYVGMLLIYMYFGFPPVYRNVYEELEDPNNSSCYLTRGQGVDLGAMTEEVNYLSYRCYDKGLFVTYPEDYQLLISNIYDWVKSQKCGNISCRLYMVDNILWDNDNVVIVELSDSKRAFFDARSGVQLSAEDYYKKNSEVFTTEEEIAIKIGNRLEEFYGNNYVLQVDEKLTSEDNYWFVIVYEAVKDQDNVIGGLWISDDYEEVTKFESYSLDYFNRQVVSDNNLSEDIVLKEIEKSVLYQNSLGDNEDLIFGEPLERFGAFKVFISESLETVDGKVVETSLTYFLVDKKTGDVFVKPTEWEARNYVFKVDKL